MRIGQLGSDIETELWIVLDLFVTQLHQQPPTWGEHHVQPTSTTQCRLNMSVLWTYSCQRLVKNWVERRLQLLLHVLKQNRIPKLDGILQHLQVVGHLKVYHLQSLKKRTEDPIYFKCKTTTSYNMFNFYIG